MNVTKKRVLFPCIHSNVCDEAVAERCLKGE
jgi:hypothetical protein